MFKRIDHIEIVTTDAEKSLEFYTGILEFAIKSRREMDRPPMKEIIFLELNDTMLELLVMKGVPTVSTEQRVGYRMMAIEVEYMDKAIDYLKSNGVEISGKPRTMVSTKRAEIKDPNGVSIELRQYG
jgi:glyoxylase I family protein